MAKLSPEKEKRWREVMGPGTPVKNSELRSGCKKEFLKKDANHDSFCYLSGSRSCNHQSDAKELFYRGGDTMPSERYYRCRKH